MHALEGLGGRLTTSRWDGASFEQQGVRRSAAEDTAMHSAGSPSGTALRSTEAMLMDPGTFPVRLIDAGLWDGSLQFSSIGQVGDADTNGRKRPPRKTREETEPNMASTKPQGNPD